MKICSIENCNKKHYAKGYCQYHYVKYRKDKKCTIKDCDNPYYAKGYCINHYCLYKRNGRPDYLKKIKYPNEICLIKNCNKKAVVKGLCRNHRQLKLKYNYTLKELEINHKKGKYNNNWNGGISDYPNHHLLKKNRLIKLESINCICEECGGKATEVHHKDNSKDNHNIDNLKGLCHRCHMQENHNSKYKILYGMTGKEIANKFNIKISLVHLRHKDGTLKKCIENNSFNSTKYINKFNMTLKEISKKLNISITTVYYKIKNNTLEL